MTKSKVPNAQTKSLIEMAAEAASLEQALLENDGVLPPALEERFDLATGQLAEKIDRYKYVIDAMESRADYYKKMEDKIKAARKLIENQSDRLKSNLKYVMSASGSTELSGNDWRSVLSSSREKLVIEKDSVPSEYLKEVVTSEPDKDAITTAIKMGFEVNGCSLEPVQSLRFYINHEGRAKPVEGKTE